MPDRTFSAQADRVEEVTCDVCHRPYQVAIRAAASVTGPEGEVAALEAEARRQAQESLDRLGPMESCPACGSYPLAMVRRIFQDPLYAALKRRHDGAFGAVNSPFARARRLAARGKDAPAIEEALAREIEQHPLLWDLVQEVAGGKLSAIDSGGQTEGEVLTQHLALTKGESVEVVRDALVALGGLDAALAREVVDRLTTDVQRGQSSITYLIGGIAVLGLGALVAFYFAIIRPIGTKAAEQAARAAQEEASRKAAELARRPVAWKTFTATERDLTVKVAVAPDGRQKLIVSARRVKRDETRIVKLIVNGEVIAHGGEHVQGDPTIEVTDLGSAAPGLLRPGEPTTIGVVAEVGELVDWETGSEETWLARGRFQVTLPHTGPEGVADEADVIQALPREEEPSALDRAVAAAGTDALAALDACLFGKPRPPAAAPADAPPMTDMDRDIRRASLKEAGNRFLSALGMDELDGALGSVAPEDAVAYRACLADLERRGFRLAGARYVDASIDPSGLSGSVRCSFDVDHAEGSFKREGTAPWSWRDERFWFDPEP